MHAYTQLVLCLTFSVVEYILNLFYIYLDLCCTLNSIAYTWCCCTHPVLCNILSAVACCINSQCCGINSVLWYTLLAMVSTVSECHSTECNSTAQSVCHMIVTGYPGVWESVKISGLNSSVGRALARYARGPGFESRLRLDFSPPATWCWLYIVTPGVFTTALSVHHSSGCMTQHKVYAIALI